MLNAHVLSQREFTGKVQDLWETPPWPMRILMPYLLEAFPPPARVWEPAAGSGRLVGYLEAAGYTVVASDIRTGHDFLLDEPLARSEYDLIVTNPPFSIKNDMIARCVELDVPWALLLPLAAMEGRPRQELFRAVDMQLLMLPVRVNYVVPEGVVRYVRSKANFPSAWFTAGLGLPSALIFGDDDALPRRALPRAERGRPTGVQKRRARRIQEWLAYVVSTCEFHEGMMY